MRVGFFGTPPFAVPTLQALVDAGHEVVVVVAQPDRPSGRGNRLTSPATVDRARTLQIPVLQPLKVRSGDFPTAIEALALDVAVVVAYGRILPLRLLEAPRLGCINVHGSLLPRWRGAAPIQWSVLAGDGLAGVTTMRMAEGLDTGDTLLCAEVPIGADETAGELFERLAPIGAALLIETLDQLPTLIAKPQDPGSVTMAPMLSREQSPIRWSEPARRIAHHVHGLNPWPGATASFREQILKIHRVRVVPGPTLTGANLPGTLLPGACVVCGDGAVELVEVQAAGRKAVRGLDFFHSARLEPGERLH